MHAIYYCRISLTGTLTSTSLVRAYNARHAIAGYIPRPRVRQTQGPQERAGRQRFEKEKSKKEEAEDDEKTEAHTLLRPMRPT